ncbi:hypothetical protein OF377_03175 [Ureaplasma sp. ES3154-GEN]|uniref:MPN551 family DNA-binding protein n=1 Tax=Ureaplasma sp. ES3154-GEN TaxID=2984844 RepID=UPI0021E7A2A3|nr:hypothetical protein [Ureaplasma sp. ES3154-GEN]MCV3743863.1 hypothetical protein [Ureaplasma sp. ES3154-GEN]
MPFIKKYGEDFILQDNRIILTKKYVEENKHRFAKITGSRLGEIMGLGEYASPLKVWCSMVRIYKEDIDPIHANAGNIIESKIFNEVHLRLPHRFVSYDPIKIGFDMFKEDPIFGGIPDGEPINLENAVDYNYGPMLEIKTSSVDKFLYKVVDEIPVLQKDQNDYPIVKEIGAKKASWFVNNELTIPKNYMLQLGLYLYLRNQTKGMFVVSFLDTKHYIDPNSYDPATADLWFQDFSVDLEKFKNVVYDPCKEWYKQHIETGISPELTPKDKKWFNIWINK